MWVRDNSADSAQVGAFQGKTCPVCIQWQEISKIRSYYHPKWNWNFDKVARSSQPLLRENTNGLLQCMTAPPICLEGLVNQSSHRCPWTSLCSLSSGQSSHALGTRGGPCLKKKVWICLCCVLSTWDLQCGLVRAVDLRMCVRIGLKKLASFWSYSPILPVSLSLFCPPSLPWTEEAEQLAWASNIVADVT